MAKEEILFYNVNSNKVIDQKTLEKLYYNNLNTDTGNRIQNMLILDKAGTMIFPAEILRIPEFQEETKEINTKKQPRKPQRDFRTKEPTFYVYIRKRKDNSEGNFKLHIKENHTPDCTNSIGRSNLIKKLRETQRQKKLSDKTVVRSMLKFIKENITTRIDVAINRLRAFKLLVVHCRTLKKFNQHIIKNIKKFTKDGKTLATIQEELKSIVIPWMSTPSLYDALPQHLKTLLQEENVDVEWMYNVKIHENKIMEQKEFNIDWIDTAISKLQSELTTQQAIIKTFRAFEKTSVTIDNGIKWNRPSIDPSNENTFIMDSETESKWNACILNSLGMVSNFTLKELEREMNENFEIFDFLHSLPIHGDLQKDIMMLYHLPEAYERCCQEVEKRQQFAHKIESQIDGENDRRHKFSQLYPFFIQNDGSNMLLTLLETYFKDLNQVFPSVYELSYPYFSLRDQSTFYIKSISSDDEAVEDERLMMIANQQHRIHHLGDIVDSLRTLNKSLYHSNHQPPPTNEECMASSDSSLNISHKSLLETIDDKTMIITQREKTIEEKSLLLTQQDDTMNEYKSHLQKLKDQLDKKESDYHVLKKEKDLQLQEISEEMRRMMVEGDKAKEQLQQSQTENAMLKQILEELQTHISFLEMR